MSIILSKSQPPVEAKTYPGSIPELRETVRIGEYEIPFSDFFVLVKYVLGNTPLTTECADMRLAFLEDLKTVTTAPHPVTGEPYLSFNTNYFYDAAKHSDEITRKLKEGVRSVLNGRLAPPPTTPKEVSEEEKFVTKQVAKMSLGLPPYEKK